MNNTNANSLSSLDLKKKKKHSKNKLLFSLPLNYDACTSEERTNLHSYYVTVQPDLAFWILC